MSAKQIGLESNLICTPYCLHISFYRKIDLIQRHQVSRERTGESDLKRFERCNVNNLSFLKINFAFGKVARQFAFFKHHSNKVTTYFYKSITTRSSGRQAFKYYRCKRREHDKSFRHLSLGF